jgi:prepilin-type N-terminal cleavage/methylation domain-containing protein
VAGTGADRQPHLYLQGDLVSPARSQRRRAQAGFTLIELIIATAIGLVVMTALTSVVFTTYQANQIAISRIQASSTIGLFSATAHDDFALSSLPLTPGPCGSSAQPCSQDPIKLVGNCTMTSTGSSANYTVIYQWNSDTHLIDRNISGQSDNPAATGVTAFSWYIDGASVLVTVTVTVGAYSQTQTLRFYPRVASQLPAYVSPPPC